MKKLVVLVGLVFFGLSCDPDNERMPEFSLELVPIESVKLPEFFVEDQSYDIEMEYLRPSVCHSLNAVNYSQEPRTEQGAGPIYEQNIVTVSIENIVFKGNNCSSEIPETERIVKATLKNFKVELPVESVYVFRFFKGKDQEENPIYFVVEVPVFPRNYEEPPGNVP